MRGTFCEHDDELFDGEVHTEEFSCRGTNGDLRTFFLLEVIQPEPSDFSKSQPSLVKKKGKIILSIVRCVFYLWKKKNTHALSC
jgi:hypothetical protein